MSSIADAPIEAGLDQPSIAARRALIDRVAASEQFRRSARLRDFLLYVGGQSLKIGCPEIHEQEIGAKVFGRPSSYDRSQDNIVRVNATELRKRIDAYFATEGAHEMLMLEIPRGGYKPVFHRRLPVAPKESASAHELVIPENQPPIEAAAARNQSRPYLYLWAAASVALAVLCLALFYQNRTMRRQLYTWEGKPAVAAFWGDFLGTGRQTDLVLPDDSASLIEDLTHSPISLGDYLNHNYMRQIQSSDLSAERKTALDNIFAHNLVTFGGVRAAQEMLSLIPASAPSNLTLSRYYEADSMKHDNIILIGGSKANPWVHLFDHQTNFITDYDYNPHQFHSFVLNTHPRPGEQAVYIPPQDANAFFSYAVIAYLPNPSHTGNVIILAGTDSDATSAAAEFITSEDRLNGLRNTFHVSKFPYFEVLLKTSRLSGTSLNAEMLAYRTYPAGN
jgi:hypothetical protein